MEIKEVFEPIISFMKNLPNRKEKDISKQAAKDRLKLVLMQDRASVSPDFFEMMKKEIIDVIKKYIEIDEESLEVQLTRGYEAGLEGPALYANIPIKNIKPVANNGEELTEAQKEEMVSNVVDEIFDEASKKVENISALVEEIDDETEEVSTEITTEAFENTLSEETINSTVSDASDENVSVAENTIAEASIDETSKGPEVIAENVAKEMKKSAAKAAAAIAAKKTVKSTTRKTSRKKATAE